MSKPLVALQNMKEFDPECERHKPLLIVKAVDPGCTLEIQVENAVTGKVVRLTSTENAERDRGVFIERIVREFLEAYAKVEM